jgi:hypothetical protein
LDAPRALAGRPLGFLEPAGGVQLLGAGAL